MQTFDKSSRLLKSYEYQLVFDKGVKDVGGHFILFSLNNDKPKNRIGLVVSKKVGNAVVRNRLKRRLREQFRLHIQSNSGAPEDLVVVARPGSNKISSADVRNDLEIGIQRIKRRKLKTAAKREAMDRQPQWSRLELYFWNVIDWFCPHGWGRDVVFIQAVLNMELKHWTNTVFSVEQKRPSLDLENVTHFIQEELIYHEYGS